MFDALTDRLTGAFRALSGQGKLSESNIEEALKEVRLSLLEADVNFRVVKSFLKSVRDKALGSEVPKGMKPEQHFVSIVHAELKHLLGGEAAGLDLAAKPPLVVMVVGLQGSGKTTSLGKLARWLKEKQGRKPYLVPADIYRPAAVDQLHRLGAQVGAPVYPTKLDQDPVAIARDAVREAGKLGCDVVLLDTAGRLQIDEPLMDELVNIKAAVSPHEILFVADAMTGQEAVNVAATFNERLDCTGVVLTKMDGDARGGAALSIKAVTGKPLKFLGIGEKLDGLEVFHPDRVAGRILGMGDILGLAEKAQQELDQQLAAESARRMMEDEFTLDDFLKQMQEMRKLGPMADLLKMLPGGSQLKELTEGEGAENLEEELRHIRAIIQSMTLEERRTPGILNASRRKRIARGCGKKVEDVNLLLKQFLDMKRMLREMKKHGMWRMMKSMFGGNMPVMPAGGMPALPGGPAPRLPGGAAPSPEQMAQAMSAMQQGGRMPPGMGPMPGMPPGMPFPGMPPRLRPPGKNVDKNRDKQKAARAARKKNRKK